MQLVLASGVHTGMVQHGAIYSVITCQLHVQIKELAQLSESTLPDVTRVLFSKEDVQAREFIRTKMRAAGMEVRCGHMLHCTNSNTRTYLVVLLKR